MKTRLKALVKSPIFWLRFAAYAIPFAFLLYVLYMNFLPFGYNKTFTIQVGTPGDTESSKEFYLQPSKDLSEPKITADGSTYRELNGATYAVFNPKAVLKNESITVSVEGEGVSIIPPVIDFDPSTMQWDKSWDFSKTIPSELKGDAFHFDDGAYFDGKSKLELPNSIDDFESGPFTVYTEWKPENNNDNFQEIVGHYNWELLQNKDSVSFQVGRMNDAQGPVYSIKYPITSDFFNNKHSAIVIYNPISKNNENGYIDLFVDKKFTGRSYINKDKIWKEYGSNQFGLSLGKAGHGAAKFLKGYVYNLNFSSTNKIAEQTIVKIPYGNSSNFIISLLSKPNSFLKRIILEINK